MAFKSGHFGTETLDYPHPSSIYILTIQMKSSYVYFKKNVIFLFFNEAIQQPTSTLDNPHILVAQLWEDLLVYFSQWGGGGGGVFWK